MKKKFYCAAMLALALGTPGVLQAQIENEQDPYSLTLEELMNIPINSASKKDETLFDAPLSSYTITRADILQAGSTSIMEALRLAPGVIVREQTNGNYDIHIRGFDNVQRTNGATEKNSLATLVMIDNRPVFNHNLGGTSWEVLPVDINDVERIEIVRGPSAPMFGPNAVNGVINIITKKVDKDTQVYATAQYGSQNTMIGQASFGKKIGEKFSIAASINFTNRERFQKSYYNGLSNSYEDFTTTPALRERFPNSDRAVQKRGSNIFLSYKPSERVKFDMSFGNQKSDAQKSLIGPNDIPLTTNITESRYTSVSGSIYGVAVRASYIDGTDQLNIGARPNGNDYHNLDLMVEYPIHVTKKITVTPGVAHQDVSFSDEKYTIEGDKTTGYLNGEFSIATSAAYVRADMSLTRNWRFLAGVRGDYFSSSENTTVAYEFASTYKIGDAHLIRAAVTRSNAGAFIAQTYANNQLAPFPGYVIEVNGTPGYKPFTVQMVEVGYRAKLSRSFQLDVDIFRQAANNFGAYLTTEFAGAPFPPGLPTKIEFRNVPTEAVQTGATLSLNIVPSEKFQFKPFVTVQRTEVEKLQAFPVSTDLMPTMTYISGESTNTPSFYGGYFANYRVHDKLYLNLNGYYFGSHNQYDKADPNGTGQYGQIDGKLLLNLKVNYSPVKNLNVFLNGRNILDQEQREFYGTDKTGATYMIGASYSLN